MNNIEKIFLRLSIIIPVILTSIHLLISTIYEVFNIGSLISLGYLSVIVLTLVLDIPLSFIIVVILNFIKETIICKHKNVITQSYLFVILSVVASLFTIICYFLLQIFINAIVNDILFMCMIGFLLLSVILFVVYIVKKKDRIFI